MTLAAAQERIAALLDGLAIGIAGSGPARLAALAARGPLNSEARMDHLEILPIGKAPVWKGEADLRPVLLAPTPRGGWTIGAWNGSTWFACAAAACSIRTSRETLKNSAPPIPDHEKSIA